MISIKSLQLDNNNNNILKINSVSDYSKDFNAKKFLRPSDPESFTSNRYDDWKEILKKNDNIFLGNGIMGDRWIINQTASNLILYNYASSGIVGVFLFALLMLRSFFICSKITFLHEKKINKHNYILLSACYIQYFLMGRSLIETSFAVFGIDFLIFFAAYFFTEEYYNKKKIKKII